MMLSSTAIAAQKSTSPVFQYTVTVYTLFSLLCFYTMLHLVHGSVARDWLLQLWGAHKTHAWSTLNPSVNSSQPSVPPRSIGKPIGMGLEQSITCSLEGWISPPPKKWEKLLRLVRGRGSRSAPHSSSPCLPLVTSPRGHAQLEGSE